MTTESLLLLLVVGLIAGWLASVVVGGIGRGLVGDIVVGIIGAFIGGSLFHQLAIGAPGGMLGSIVVRRAADRPADAHGGAGPAAMSVMSRATPPAARRRLTVEGTASTLAGVNVRDTVESDTE